MSTAVLDQFIDQLADAVAKKIESRQSQPSETSTDGPEFMNKGNVAEYLNVSRTTIDRWIKQRGFPSSKVGGKYVYKREDVDRWVAEHTK